MGPFKLIFEIKIPPIHKLLLTKNGASIFKKPYLHKQEVPWGIQPIIRIETTRRIK